MSIPSAATTQINLNESHTPLDKPSCHQAGTSSSFGSFVFDAIKVESFAGFIRKIVHFGDAGLHFPGEFISGNASIEPICWGRLVFVSFVQPVQIVKFSSLPKGRNLRRRSVEENWFSTFEKASALIGCRNKTTAPIATAPGYITSAVRKDYERWQVVAFISQTINRPST